MPPDDNGLVGGQLSEAQRKSLLEAVIKVCPRAVASLPLPRERSHEGAARRRQQQQQAAREAAANGLLAVSPRGPPSAARAPPLAPADSFGSLGSAASALGGPSPSPGAAPHVSWTDGGANGGARKRPRADDDEPLSPGAPGASPYARGAAGAGWGAEPGSPPRAAAGGGAPPADEATPSPRRDDSGLALLLQLSAGRDR